MGNDTEERILVVPRELFDRLGAFEGIAFDVEKYLPHFLDPANNYFLPRSSAEDDPTHKQIIPYAIFRHGKRYLHYVRGGGGGEKRLHAKGSIGIGGHINEDDFAAASLDRDTYTNGVEREIDEELDIDCEHTQKIIALINDDSNDVGRVHLGVVHLFELEGDGVMAAEEGLEQLSFLTLEELEARRESLETWSQICLDGLLRLR